MREFILFPAKVEIKEDRRFLNSNWIIFDSHELKREADSFPKKLEDLIGAYLLVEKGPGEVRKIDR